MDTLNSKKQSNYNIMFIFQITSEKIKTKILICLKPDSVFIWYVKPLW